jgi:hypothetical protein
LAVSLGCLGGRLDKTGDTQMTASGGDEAVGKPGVAGVDTNQRLSLSTTWEGLQLICRGFKPDSGNLTVRDYRGASEKEQPTRPQSSGVQVPAPPIACLRAVSISDGRDQLTLVCSAGDRPARAKVRSLVVWMAGRRERKFSEVLKAHRQGLPWGDHESPGRNNSKRRCSLENARSEGRAHHRRAKVAWDAEI